MNNYKKLLEDLDGMDFFCDRAGKELWFDKPKEVQDEDIAFHHETLTEAISAIKRLCSDVERLEAETRAKEQYIAETIGKVILDSNPRMTPCELAEENDKLKQKVTALCKERDEAHRTIDQLVIRLNDETAKVARLEAENRAKEQYIAEKIGGVYDKTRV